MRKRMAQPVCLYIALIKKTKKEIRAKGRHENVELCNQTVMKMKRN